MIAFAKKVFLALPMMMVAANASAFEPKLYNTYFVDNGMTRVTFATCGSTSESTGCFGSGSMGPFRQTCAIVATPTRTTLETNGSTTLSRRVAVMDRGTQATDLVQLSVYEETINFTSSNATPASRLLRTINLSLKGGPSASCSLARAGSFFFVGTNKSTNAVRVDAKYAVTTLPGFSPPEPVVNISTTADGNVAVTHTGGHYLYQKDGSLLQDGGGSDFVVGSADAVHLGPNAPYIPGFFTAVAPVAASSQNVQSLPMFVNGGAVLRSGSGTVIFDGTQALAR